MAAVSGTAFPTGTVTFSDCGTTLGKGTVSSVGLATYTATFLAGTHALTASYSGDADFATSSGSFAELVKLNATTTTLVAAPTSTACPGLTLGAHTVSPGVPAPVFTPACSTLPCTAPSVSFYAGTTLLGSATLDATGGAVRTR